MVYRSVFDKTKRAVPTARLLSKTTAAAMEAAFESLPNVEDVSESGMLASRFSADSSVGASGGDFFRIGRFE